MCGEDLKAFVEGKVCCMDICIDLCLLYRHLAEGGGWQGGKVLVEGKVRASAATGGEEWARWRRLDDDDRDEYKSVWPTWAVGALFGDARCIRINCVCFHINSPSLRSRDILVKGRKHHVVCQHPAAGGEEWAQWRGVGL